MCIDYHWCNLMLCTKCPSDPVTWSSVFSLPQPLWSISTRPRQALHSFGGMLWIGAKNHSCGVIEKIGDNGSVSCFRKLDAIAEK
jgi:hypothetical protein